MSGRVVGESDSDEATEVARPTGKVRPQSGSGHLIQNSECFLIGFLCFSSGWQPNSLPRVAPY